MPNGDQGYTTGDHYNHTIRDLGKKLCMLSPKNGEKLLKTVIDDIEAEKERVIKELNRVEDRENQKQAILAKLTDEEKKLIGVF